MGPAADGEGSEREREIGEEEEGGERGGKGKEKGGRGVSFPKLENQTSAIN